MKGLDFLDIVGEIDEKYIEEAEKKKIHHFNYKQILPCAAAFFLICTLSLSGFQQLLHPQDESSNITEIGNYDDSDVEINKIEEKTIIDEEKNIFEEIFENIVSFFENLRF